MCFLCMLHTFEGWRALEDGLQDIRKLSDENGPKK